MSEPRSLYVHRPLKNADAILEWARAAGFSKPLEPGDMHVTIAFSRAPVDWHGTPEAEDDLRIAAAGEQKNGARSVEKLGDLGAVVLRFESPDLTRRWHQFGAAGASWDHPGYKPHVTLTYHGGDIDLSKVQPYDGPMEFGPEVFQPVDEGWADKVKAKTAQDERLAFDRMSIFDAPRAGAKPDLRPGLAFDRESVRSYDADGRLRVATANISKAAINPYLGREIPDWEKHGLDPDKIYSLLRHPEEIEKAAATFNALPVLSKHIAVTADDHQPDLVIGATGSEAEFAAPYLRNSLVLWAKGGIEAVESEERKELSSAYRYRADMTPGTWEGKPYDGVMRDIVGNHVALVREGRAGPDVVVGDSNEEIKMAAGKIILTRMGAAVQGALIAHLTPKLAKDAQIVFPKILHKITAKNFAENIPGLVEGLKKGLEGKLAKDASLDDVTGLLDHLKGSAPAEKGTVDAMETDPNTGEPLPVPEDDEANDADPHAALKSFLEGKLSPEDMAEVVKLMGEHAVGGAGDEPPPFPGKPKPGGGMDADPASNLKKKDDDEGKEKPMDRKAMDAAIATAVEKTKLDAKAQRDAERAVRPYVGELVAMDSADQVYSTALAALGVDVKDVHPSAFPALLKTQKTAAQRNRSAVETPQIAADAATAESFAKRYPGSERIRAV